MTGLAPSRRFAIAKALEALDLDLELSLAIIEWEAGETDATVRGVLKRLLARRKIAA